MNEISRRDLLTLRSLRGQPGTLKVNPALCTGCGLCVTVCPASALEMTRPTPNALRLDFQPSACDSCGKCVEACPEKCLALERSLETATGKVLIFTGEMVCCQECGAPIGPAGMIEKVKKALGESAGFDSSAIMLCPECKQSSLVKKLLQRG